MSAETRWRLAGRAVICLALAAPQLGGLWLRARAGPVRERLLAAVRTACGPARRLTPEIGDEALFGGIDVAASLGAGTLVSTPGLLDQPGFLILPMAERARAGLAARLASALDTKTGLTLLALDEGIEDESLAASLGERLGLHLDLDGIAVSDAGDLTPDAARLAAARRADPAIPDGAVEALATTAAVLGVTSLRAPILALRAARALAAWEGRAEIDAEALADAVGLVLAPRATVLPEPEADPDDAPEPPEKSDQPPPEDDRSDNDGLGPIPPEVLLEAARAAVPPDLLERLAAGRAARVAAGSTGAGARRKGNRRGRPLPAQPGDPSGEARVDVIATLRAAAPWQRLRADAAAHRPGRRLRISRGDIRLRRFEERSDRALIFVVDASGSAAMTRLAEAKGAVELLLGQAYARRDHVALIAFRGTGSELLLPPTRSLVQTKRRLAGLPGGGGTPLAAGLREALALGIGLRGRGMTPAIALLTDGRANVALDGQGDRTRAGEEALALARGIRAQALPALVIDTGVRPTRGLDALAAEMGAQYLPLPRAQAEAVSTAVGKAFGP
ncbi:MAG: magnesium chelatase subunit D [Pseudomonadota bacterium]